ncbi:unnamed protein product, partial [marine sediment metagenome]
YLVENLCDRVVLEVTGEPVLYANMLSKMARNLSGRVLTTELAVGIIFSKSMFFRRIRAILSDKSNKIKRISKIALLGTIAGIVISLILAISFPIGEVNDTDNIWSFKRKVTFHAKVVDSQTGKPVERFILRDYKHREIVGISDKDGLIEIDGMNTGPFAFNFQAEGYTRWWSKDAINESQHRSFAGKRFQENFIQIGFRVHKNMKPVLIEAEKGVMIYGHVIDPEGNPVARATVAPARSGTGNSLTGDTRFSVISKDDGSFEMLLPASWYCKHHLVAHDGDYKEWRTWA